MGPGKYSIGSAKGPMTERKSASFMGPKRVDFASVAIKSGDFPGPGLYEVEKINPIGTAKGASNGGMFGSN